MRPGALQVTVPIADIRDAPDGARLRQLLYGDPVEVTADHGAHLVIRARRDGYEGVMRRADLGPQVAATHRLCVPASHSYGAPDLKSPERHGLSFGSLLTVTGAEGRFVRLHDGGFVPEGHVAPVAARHDDPVAVAALFLGTPYLWGGNSRAGIDCSGLVQVACLACGVACPGDSGDQERALGVPIAEEAPVQRGDLLFWAGHVAWVAAPDMLLHANAHAMAVAFEPMAAAVERIAAQGGGPVTSRRRLAPVR